MEKVTPGIYSTIRDGIIVISSSPIELENNGPQCIMPEAEMAPPMDYIESSSQQEIESAKDATQKYKEAVKQEKKATENVRKLKKAKAQKYQEYQKVKEEIRKLQAEVKEYNAQLETVYNDASLAANAKRKKINNVLFEINKRNKTITKKYSKIRGIIGEYKTLSTNILSSLTTLEQAHALTQATSVAKNEAREAANMTVANKTFVTAQAKNPPKPVTEKITQVVTQQENVAQQTTQVTNETIETTEEALKKSIK